MNIDWHALNKGVSEELEKVARSSAAKVTNQVQKITRPLPPKAIPPTPAPPAIQAPATPSPTPLAHTVARVGVPTAMGAYAINRAGNAVKDAYSAGKEGLEGLSGFLPAALGLMAGGKGNAGMQQPEGFSSLLNAIKGKPNLLNYDTGAPHSLGDAVAGAGLPNMGWGKTASITEAITKAVQTRAINDAMDKMLLHKQETAPAPQDKRLEITSKYPEMQTMLKDEQNKAYLERLLKE